MVALRKRKDRAIRYLYDANGNKLRKIVFGEQGHIEYIRDYSGSFVYTDGAMDFILTDEGRVNNKVEGLTYEYFLKDHLGNTRVSFEVDNGTINTTGETHYYPFGMTLHGLNQPLRRHRDPVKSQYLYNGKELQTDNGLEWYDFGPYHGSKSEEREIKRDLNIQAGAQKTEDKIYKDVESGGIGPVTVEENEECTTIKSDFDAEVEVNAGIVGVEVSMLFEYTKKNRNDKSSSRSIRTEKRENDEKYTKNHY